MHRRLVWLALLCAALLAGGCSLRRTTLPPIPPEVVELSANLDEYLTAYRERYHLRPRPAADPLGVAEAYLRQYQPGPLPRVFQTTILYDRLGVKLAEITDEGYRTWVPLSRISPHLINAIIATEDSTFFSNPGYDARRVIAAMMQNAEAGEVVSGASTITMQLARQIFFSPQERYEQSMDRKAFEALLAQDLTTLYTKDEILEMYLNLVHFGRQVYGAEAASTLYFGKTAAELTLAEATLLAGIPQKPGSYDLFTNLDAVKQRQGVVLSLMVRHGYLTRAEADAIFGQQVALNPEAGRPLVLAPHFVDYVTNVLTQHLGGIDARRAGMRVFTTLDLRMQNLAQQIVADQVKQLQPRYNLSNGALVALRPGTAEILVMVGSADFNNTAIAGQVNVAVRQRQPGSAIKPVLYALAVDDNLISPATLVWDVPVRYNLEGTDDYRPRNYDEQFHGPVTVRTALANSYNIPAVKLLDAIGIERMLARARAMGLNSLNRDPNWYGLSLTLGGGEVTLLDLTTAFHTIANQGRYVAPQAVLFTTGAPEGRDLNLGTVQAQQVIAPESAYIITSILSDNKAREPEFGANSALKLSKPAAAKTGTTSDWRDNWTEGFTRYLVAGVWAGNSDGKPMRNVTGVTGAAPIWHAFMEGVLADPALLKVLGAPADPADTEAWEFVRPEGVLTETVTCPPGLQCPGSEVFSRRWLDRMGNLGPLGDSMISGHMRLVYVDRGNGRRVLGACSAIQPRAGDRDAVQQLVRMPFGLTRALPLVDTRLATTELTPQVGVADPLAPPAQALQANGQNVQAVNTQLEGPPTGALIAEMLGTALDTNIDEDRLRRIRQEQADALAWSSRYRTPLFLGPCEHAEQIARFMYGDSVRAVAVAGEDVEREQFVAEEEQTQPREGGGVLAAAAPSAGTASSSYALLGVAHDANCGGNYVMGQVFNAQGQAVPGVAVSYSDESGNFAQTVTSSAAQGYGSFRFPIAAPEQSHTIYIAVQGGTSTATVAHRQGGATDQGCHYVIWRGAD
jgi:penicillin-binding protein 1C